MEAQKSSVPECCPQFDPAAWSDKTLSWEIKKFIKDKVRTFLYLPLNFGQVMRRCNKLIRKAGGNVVENMGLSDHTSGWNMEIYIAVDKEITGAQNTACPKCAKKYGKNYVVVLGYIPTPL